MGQAPNIGDLKNNPDLSPTLGRLKSALGNIADDNGSKLNSLSEIQPKMSADKSDNSLASSNSQFGIGRGGIVV